jgi:hypothetical protein
MEWMRERGGYPDPDWKTLRDEVGFRPGQSSALRDAIGIWLRELCDALGEGYRLVESSRFIVISAWPASEEERLTHLLEQAVGFLQKSVPGMAWLQETKPVVILFESAGRCDEYFTLFDGGDGERIRAGALLHEFVPQLLLAPSAIEEQEPAVLHALAHLMSSGMAPYWVDEGIAVNAECLSRHGRLPAITPELAETVREQWDSATVQAFWSGSSFFEAETQAISRAMAARLVELMAQDPEPFERFVGKAENWDGGEAAALEVFGRSLGDFLRSLVGRREAPIQSIS